jgi:dockerin type I repeat protein
VYARRDTIVSLRRFSGVPRDSSVPDLIENYAAQERERAIMNRSSRLCTTAMVALILAIWLMLVQSVAAQTLRAGDVNGDGGINVIDVQLTVNVALEVNTDPTIQSRADVNGDGVVNVVDVQRVVNMVLNVGSSISIASFNKFSAAPFSSLIINGTGFDPENGAISVHFVPLGTNVPIVIPVFVASPTSLTVMVPPLFDGATGQFSSGPVDIQVIQAVGSTLMTSNVLSGLSVMSLPSVNLSVGGISQAYLTLALSQVQQVQTFAAGLANGADLLAAANAYADDLNSLLAAVNTIRNGSQQTVALPTANGTSFTLDALTLATLDQVITAMITQIMNQVQTGTFASAAPQFAWPPTTSKNPLLHLVQASTTCPGANPNEDPQVNALWCGSGFPQYTQSQAQLAPQAFQFGVKVYMNAYLGLLGGWGIAGFQTAGAVSATTAKTLQLAWSVGSPSITALMLRIPAPSLSESLTKVGVKMLDTWMGLSGFRTLSTALSAINIYKGAATLASSVGSSPQGGLITPAPSSDLTPGTRAAFIFQGSDATATAQRVRLPLGQQTVAIMNVLLPLPPPECDQCSATQTHCKDQCDAQSGNQCLIQCFDAYHTCNANCPRGDLQCVGACDTVRFQCEKGCDAGACFEQCDAAFQQCFNGPPACQ